MSYLRNYSKGAGGQTSESNVSLVASTISDPDQEAKFTHLRLNSIAAQAVINSLSKAVQAINLSNNRIDQLPRSIPATVVGLNLSHNLLYTLRGVRSLGHLIELNVSHNRLTSLAELSSLMSLQYLDVSFNSLEVIEGLENLKALKHFRCTHNKLATTVALRSLSFNTNLESIDVAENPLSQSEAKIFLLNLLPTLKYLDGQVTKVSQRGYVDQLSVQRQRGGSRPPQPSPSALSDLSLWSQPDTHPAHTYSSRHRPSSSSSRPLEEDIDRLASETEDTEGAESVSGQENIVRYSALPWRNPPHPIPRALQSRISVPVMTKFHDFDRSKSPINYYHSRRDRGRERDDTSHSRDNSVQSRGRESSGGGLHRSTSAPLLPAEISTMSVDGRHLVLPADPHPHPSDRAQRDEDFYSNTMMLSLASQQSRPVAPPLSAVQPSHVISTSYSRAYNRLVTKRPPEVERPYDGDEVANTPMRQLPLPPPTTSRRHPTPPPTPVPPTVTTAAAQNRGRSRSRERRPNPTATTNTAVATALVPAIVTPFAAAQRLRMHLFPESEPRPTRSSSDKVDATDEQGEVEEDRDGRQGGWMAPQLRTATSPISVSPPTASDREALWSHLDVATRWDVVPLQPRARSRSPSMSSRTSGRGDGSSSGPMAGRVTSRSRSPTRTSVLRAEFVRQQLETREKEASPTRPPRFVDKIPNPRRRRRSAFFDDVLGGPDPHADELQQPPASSSDRTSRSKSPYQSLVEIKMRIQRLLDRDGQRLSQPTESSSSVKNTAAVSAAPSPPKPIDRPFDFLRGTEEVQSAAGSTTSSAAWTPRSVATSASAQQLQQQLQHQRAEERKALERESGFLKRMHHYLKLMDSPASTENGAQPARSESTKSTQSLPLTAENGLALYEDLLRRRAQLLEELRFDEQDAVAVNNMQQFMRQTPQPAGNPAPADATTDTRGNEEKDARRRLLEQEIASISMLLDDVAQRTQARRSPQRVSKEGMAQGSSPPPPPPSHPSTALNADSARPNDLSRPVEDRQVERNSIASEKRLQLQPPAAALPLESPASTKPYFDHLPTPHFTFDDAMQQQRQQTAAAAESSRAGMSEQTQALAAFVAQVTARQRNALSLLQSHLGTESPHPSNV